MDWMAIAAGFAEQFRQQAQRADQSWEVVAEQVRQLAASGLYRPLLEADRLERFDYLELMSSACGVTTFVSSQHESACRRVVGTPLAAQFLPEWTSGRRLAGICFAHIRRPRVEVEARLEGGHLRFRGTAPWFTGWGLMQDVVVAGTTAEGDFLFAVTELDRVRPGPVQLLCAMQASNTVALELDLELPAERLLARVTPQELAGRDLANIVANSARSLGVTRAALELVPEPLLRREYESLRQRARRWQGGEDGLEIRARAVRLGLLAAQASVVSAGGRANSLDHPAQRLVREAMFYSVTQLTRELGQTTIAALLRACCD
ncbi:MAG: acyl-CoA dehydrogenase [Vulcanimicrobiota bacterium]